MTKTTAANELFTMTVEDGTGGSAASNSTNNGGTQQQEQQQPQQQQQVGKLGAHPQVTVEQAAPAAPATGPAVCVNFAQYAERHPDKAKRLCRQVSEVTGILDERTIAQAFDRSRRNPQSDFNVSVAIEWILDSANQLADSSGGVGSAVQLPNSPKLGNQQQQVVPVKRPLAPSNQGLPSNTTAMPPAVAMDRPTTSAVAPETAQPPNSPVRSASSNAAAPATPGSAGNKALVDLTEGNKAMAGEDAELEKAIKLSLQEAQQTSAATAGNFGGSQMTQEDQDVSRALEASLLETQMNGAKRKRGETWVDPLNPHERERNGMVSSPDSTVPRTRSTHPYLHYVSVSEARGVEERWTNLLVLSRDTVPVLSSRVSSPSPQLHAAASIPAGQRHDALNGGSEEKAHLRVHVGAEEAFRLDGRISKEVRGPLEGGRVAQGECGRRRRW